MGLNYLITSLPGVFSRIPIIKGLISADKVEVDKIGTATYDDLNDMFKLFVSPGVIKEGVTAYITDAGSQTVNVAAGTGVIRKTDSDVAQLYFCDWEASNGISVTTDSILYIGVEYDSVSGAAQVTTKATKEWNYDTEFPLGSVLNVSDVLYILNDPWWTADAVTNIIERFQADGFAKRDDSYGGLKLGVTATRYPTVTASKVWTRLNENDIDNIDCSVSDTFYTFYRDGGTGWTRGAATDQYLVTGDIIDDNSGALTAIDNNKFANWWVFVELGSSQLMLIHPQNEYNTAAEAEDEDVPTFPSTWYEHGIFIGRIIFKQGVDTPIAVESVFDTMFRASVAENHNYLDGLQGGAVDEYYHLTSAEYTNLISFEKAAVLGTL